MIAFSAGVTIPAALEKPLDLPELGTDASANAFPELAADNLRFQDYQSFTMDITNTLGWLNTMNGKDTVHDVPNIPNSPCLTTLLNKLPDLSRVRGSPRSKQQQWGWGTARTLSPVSPMSPT